MLKFASRFWEEEERCGFLVSRMMKRTWAAQLEVLQEIIKICEKYSITYYANFGTLLGAVRHKGYIPWDDDLDISMKRVDYNRFLQVAKLELPREYVILNNYSSSDWSNVCSRVINSEEISINQDRLEKYHGCPFSVGVDIFPLDYVPRDPDLFNAQVQLFDLCRELFHLCADEITNIPLEHAATIIIDGISMLENYCDLSSGRDEFNKIMIAWDQLSSLGNENPGEFLVSNQIQLKNSIKWNREWFDNTTCMTFECMDIKVPREYHKVLSNLYGDYMFPRLGTAGHDYPYYRQQLEMLLEHNMWDIEDVLLDLNREDIQQKRYCENDVARIEVENIKGANTKTLLYYPAEYGFYRYEEQYIEKIRRSFEIILKNDAIVMWFMASKFVHSSYIERNPALYAQYDELKKEYCNHPRIIWDESTELMKTIPHFDAYYGDKCPECEEIKKAGKPIMIQNYDI